MDETTRDTTPEFTDGSSPATATVAPRGSLRGLLGLRDFRLLFTGASTSLLGDQFVLIATPWLVLQLTGDPVALGVVLALEGLPRALFMLLGGAVTDRYSARKVMIVADAARAFLTAAMAASILAGTIHLGMVYAFALAFGTIAGFAIPAENSMVPLLVHRDDLKAGNALIMGATQFSAFVGPTVAGIVIASFTASLTGVGVAFATDSATFVVSSVAFILIRRRPRTRTGHSAPALHRSVWEGIRAVLADVPLRFAFLVLASVNLLLVGPLMVGIPLIAHERLAEDATAFGVLMAAFAVGNLGGYIIAGATPQPGRTGTRVILLGTLASFGAVVALLSVVTHLWLGFGLFAVVGAGNGYLAVTLFTWVQGRTSEQMLGRTMSLVTFSSIGLVSVSQFAAGALAKWNLDALFLGSGLLVLATTVAFSRHQGLRAFLDTQSSSTSPSR